MTSRVSSSSGSALPPLFRMAAITGVKASVMLHLQRGADVNATDDKGRSPLVLAAERGHTEICQILLEAGADPTLRDAWGDDALSVAINNGRKDVEAVLRLHLFPPRIEPPTEGAAPAGSRAPSHSPSAGGDTFDDGEPGDIFEDGDFDLSVWEEEAESPPPPGDPSCLATAGEIQERISRHVPIDTDEDWTDVDIDLPRILALRRRRTSEEDAAWQITARNLLLAGLNDGWVTEEQIAAAVPPDEDDQESPDIEYLTALRVVLGDIGILVEDVPDAFAPLRPQAREGEEDELHEDRDDAVVNEAVAFLADFQSYVNDPLTQYVKDVGPKKVLSREEEIDLAHEISDGTREALGAIPRSPAAMAEILDWLGRAQRGDVPIHLVVSGGGNTESEEGPRQSGEDEEESETGDDDCSEREIPVHIPLPAAFPSGLLDKITTIRALYSRMAESHSMHERLAIADRLRDEIFALGLSNEILERLWRTVDRDSLDSGARDILAHGLKRAQEAKKRFAESNLRLVLWVARKYRGLPLMDLVQEGNIGLLKAIDRFDPHHGAKFSTYATWWIRQSVTRALADKVRLIRLPVHMVETVRKVEIAANALSACLGRVPTAEELAGRLELPASQVRRIQMASQEPVPADEIADLERPLEESIVDSITPSPEDVAVHAALKGALEEALECLTRRELEVIRLRFGLDDDNDRTLEEVGQVYGVTRERIRQIEVKALRKLGHPGRSKRLRSFLDATGCTGRSD